MNPLDAEDFKDNFFDSAIIAYVLHHCDDPVSVLKEAKRVCRGNIIIFEDIEVDFVVRSSRRAFAVEVKSSNAIDFKDTKSMREFLKTHPEIDCGMIVYAGSEIYPVATNIYAVPWFAL